MQKKENQMKKNIRFITILFILALAAGSFFRFFNLKTKGIFQWDEGYYLNEAKTLRHTAEYIVENGLPFSVQQLRKYVGEKGCVLPSGVAKPTFITILSLWLLLFGATDYAAFILSAILGCFTIFLVYKIGSEFFDERSGFFSAVLLVFSGYNIFYARSAHSSICSIFFLALATLVFLRAITDNAARPRNYFLPGVLLSLAYTSHYNILPNVGIFLFFAFVASIGKNGSFKRFLFFIIGFLLPIVFYECIFRAAVFVLERFVFSEEFASANYMTYLQFLNRQYSSVISGAGWFRHDWMFYPRLLLRTEGAAFIILLAAGSVFIAIKRLRRYKLPEIFAALQFLLPLLFWVVNPGVQVGRCILPTILFAIIYAGIITSQIAKSILGGKQRNLNIFCACLFGVFAVSNIGNVREIVTMKAGYLEAAKFIKNEGMDTSIIVFNTTAIWQFYLEKQILPSDMGGILNEEDFLHLFEKHGKRYFISDFTDRQKLLASENYDFSRKLENENAPIKSFAVGLTNFEPLLCETFSAGMANMIKNDPHARLIRMYDLKKIYGSRSIGNNE